MRKSLLTAVSAAALISAGMVSPTFAQSNSDTTQPAQSESQANPSPDAAKSDDSSTMKSDSSASSDAEKPADTAETKDAMPADENPTKMDSADSEMKADTAEQDTASSDEMATEQPEGTYMASELTGEPVQNSEGEDLAQIDDFVIDQDGKISHVIVSFGGFLGLGDKEVMLPWEQLEITTDPDDEDDMIAMLNMTKEEIESLPEFKTREEVRDETEAQQAPAADTGTGTGTMGTTGTTGTATQ